MPQCEDFPCCGHTAGDCPETGSDGVQRSRCCECKRVLPANAESSICGRCQERGRHNDGWVDDHWSDY